MPIWEWGKGDVCATLPFKTSQELRKLLEARGLFSRGFTVTQEVSYETNWILHRIYYVYAATNSYSYEFVHRYSSGKNSIEWMAMPSSRGSSQLRDQTCISYAFCTSCRFFIPSTTWEEVTYEINMILHRKYYVYTNTFILMNMTCYNEEHRMLEDQMRISGFRKINISCYFHEDK